MKEEKWCSRCGTEFAEYEDKGKMYCSECLVDYLHQDCVISSYDVTHYKIEGEYLGTDDDLQEVAENIAKILEIKTI